VVRNWPGAGATPVSRGDRFPGSTCRQEARGRTVDGRQVSSASAIEASSAVAAMKLGGSVWPEPEATPAASGVRCLGSTCRRSVGASPPLVGLLSTLSRAAPVDYLAAVVRSLAT